MVFNQVSQAGLPWWLSMYLPSGVWGDSGWVTLSRKGAMAWIFDRDLLS